MKRFLNCSNHILNEEQVIDLVHKGFDSIINLPDELRVAWGQLTPSNYVAICEEIIKFAYANNITHIHLAGFMPAVTYMCKKYEGPFMFWYSYSVRKSVEKVVENQIIKTSIFEHQGWFLY